MNPDPSIHPGPAAGYLWCDTPETVAQAAGLLGAERRIALDTESNSFHVYFEKVCTIQISGAAPGPARAAAPPEPPPAEPAAAEQKIRLPDLPPAGPVFLLDPLAAPDLSPLKPLLEDPAVEKVLHGADYDVACMKRDFAISMRGIFDTCAAADLLGLEGLGLQALVERFFGIRLPKAYTRFRWHERPLPKGAMDYLVEDVHFLLPLADLLRGMLAGKDLLEEAALAFREIEDLLASRGEYDPDGFYTVRGVGDLSPEEAGILKEVWRVRDRLARAWNWPPFRVVQNDTLMGLCVHRPRRIEDLRRFKGIGPRVFHAAGPDLVDGILRGERPENRQDIRALRRAVQGTGPTGVEEAREKALRAWAREEAALRGVGVRAVLPAHLIRAFARRPPRAAADWAQFPAMGAGRITRYADKIIQVISTVPDTLPPRRGRRPR